MNKKKILLVDDDEDLLIACSTFLEASGYAVDTATSGEDGLAKARASRPDLMILDVMMTTVTEGFEVSRQIKQSEELKDIPVVILTGVRKAKDLTYAFDPDEDWLPVKKVLEILWTRNYCCPP